MVAGLFALLVGLAAFSFVLRMVEGQVVRRQVMGIAAFYYGVGQVRGDAAFYDASAAAGLIARHGDVGWVSRTTSAQGFWLDGLNAHVTGYDAHAEATQRTEVLVYAEFVRWLTHDTVEMRVHEVIFAHPEHATVGQLLQVRIAPEIAAIGRDLAADGQIYFVRAVYRRQAWPPFGGQMRFDPGFGPWIPRQSERADPVQLLELHTAYHHEGLAAALRRENSQLLIQTVYDMPTNPHITGNMQLAAGRWLTRADYAQAAPVAVINIYLAEARGLAIGDTMTIEVPRQQRFNGPIAHGHYQVPHIVADGTDSNTMEVTIVGIMRFIQFNRDRTQSLFVYVPGSVLPAVDITWREEGFLPAEWFSFAVTETRNQGRFRQDLTVDLLALGARLYLFYEDAANFWLSAAPVLLVVVFNQVLFAIVAGSVLGLVAYLFLRGRVREMAILRALGQRRRRVMGFLLSTAVVVIVPTAVLGGWLAWAFGISRADEALAQLSTAYEESIPLTDFEIQFETMFGRLPPQILDNRRVITHVAALDAHWLWLFTGGLIVTTLALFALGGWRAVHRPVLVQLQGDQQTNIPKKHKNLPAPTTPPAHDFTAFNATPLPQVRAISRIAGMAAKLRWTMRHLRRARAKTALGFVVTLFFVLALGWLYSGIARTDEEIDRLYNTTYITGTVLSALSRANVRTISDIEYVRDVHLLTQVNYIRLDSRRPVSPMMGATGMELLYPMTVTYSIGFDDTSFFYAGQPYIPVLVTPTMLLWYDLAIGETFTLSENLFGMAGLYEFHPAIIAGVHDGGHTTIVPYWVMEIFRGTYQYLRMEIVINPVHNRYLTEVITALRRTGHVFNFTDNELRSVVNALEQVLLMMSLFYQVVIILAVGIGTVLALLLVLTHTKNAAVLQVLGAGRLTTGATLWVEQFFICLLGAALGLAVSPWVYLLGILPVISLYLLGAMLGAVTGAYIVTRKAPLALLQVRE